MHHRLVGSLSVYSPFLMITVVLVSTVVSDPSDSPLCSLTACFIACKVSVTVSVGATLLGRYLSGRFAFSNVINSTGSSPGFCCRTRFKAKFSKSPRKASSAAVNRSPKPRVAGSNPAAPANVHRMIDCPVRSHTGPLLVTIFGIADHLPTNFEIGG